jgi:isocitrate/isopropylmalate dehydrogenase
MSQQTAKYPARHGFRNKDAMLFGSAGDPEIFDRITLSWRVRLKMRQELDQYGIGNSSIRRRGCLRRPRRHRAPMPVR